MNPGASGYRFGDVVVDPVAFRVERSGRPLVLEPKALDLLLYLLARPGQLVSKDELIAAVWREVAVTDNALTRLIAQLRRELGDDAQQARYIETVKTRGYRFIAVPLPVPAVEDTATTTTMAAGDRVSRPIVTSAALVAFVALLVVARGWTGGTLGWPTTDVRSLAVLPLEAGGGAETYFAAGVTQGIHQALSERGSPAVTGLASSLRFRQPGSTPEVAARQLGVDGVLRGRIERTGDWMTLHLSLIDGVSGKALWAGSYERPMTSAPALYDEVAAAVAATIAPQQSRTAVQRRARTVEPVAYRAYLRGSYFHNYRWMAGGCVAAERYLKEAIELDPNFAPAYAALAWCYAYPDRTGRDIAEVGGAAKQMVAAALSLDDRLALGHAVLGTIKWRVDYDPDAAEPEFERALALDPNSGLVRIPYAELLLWHRGRRAEGLALIRPVIDLDPFSPDRHVQVGYILMTVGEDDQAQTMFRKALELDPQYGAARLWLAETLAYQGRRDEAIQEYLGWLDVALQPAIAPRVRRDLEQAYRLEGWHAFWRRELAWVGESSESRGDVWTPPYERYVGSYYVARRYAHMGDRDKALDALDAAYAARHHQLASVPVDRLFAPFRGDVRFDALLQKVSAAR